MPASLRFNNTRGFTLIEGTIATFILTVGVLGAFALIQIIILFPLIISSQLSAVYLVQEGVESVRNIRDSNWLAQTNWDEGISSTDWVTIDKFQRKITIQKLQDDQIVVSVAVKWSERGSTRQIAAETELYNWR